MQIRSPVVVLAGLLLGVSVFVSGRAEAQMIPRSVEVDLFGSYFSFMARGGEGRDATVKLENFQDNFEGGARIGFHFAEFIAFEATFGMVQTSTDDTRRSADYINAHFDAVAHLPFPHVVPYFALGAGFQHYNIMEEYARGEGPADFTLVYRDPYDDHPRLDSGNYLTYRSADGDFLVDAGGGAKFVLYENVETGVGFSVGLRVDVRWKLSIGDATPGDGIPTLDFERDDDGNAVATDWNGVFHHVSVGGGVFVLLGGGIGPDRDGDKITNRKDACPDDPEDMDDFEDEDGCPDNDNDKDGVVDSRDDCPLEPEDKDTWEDQDGCPDIDNDSDGFFDAQDACPLDAEDKDGFEDTDGCPELDNDGDGFLDENDSCPRAMETFNSYLDRDGCPDEVPADLVEFAGAIPAIQFEVNSARLKRSALPILKKAANALNRYPDLHVEVAGHASSEGQADANMRLSQDRTVSVRDYLIDRGVDPSRVSARGYGETRPVAPNDTEAGRRANRRVEFLLERMTD
ncbi:MAG TPA: hypothetical protein DIU15_10800 [Deltaproteobacteria bacterium]|nr:hypothetical protein [Deltaproteobacteria bacterium]HCP46525.1 hypothetical protein [Deltaproteobacteria bacterium]